MTETVGSAEDQRREAWARRTLRRKGFVVRKDRVRSIGQPLNIDHRGGYMIIDADTNAIAAGERFDLTLDALVSWAAGR